MRTAWLLLLSLLLIASSQSVDGQRKLIKQLKKSVSGLKKDVQRILSLLDNQQQRQDDQQQRIGKLYPNVIRLRSHSLFASISVLGICVRFHLGGGNGKTALGKKIV